VAKQDGTQERALARGQEPRPRVCLVLIPPSHPIGLYRASRVDAARRAPAKAAAAG
jgi:hypothetical protein